MPNQEPPRPLFPRGIAIPTKQKFADAQFTPAESVLWIARMCEAMHTNGRLLCDVQTVQHTDGSLTIRVTPHAQ